MRRRLAIMVGVLALMGAPLRAQEVADRTASAGDPLPGITSPIRGSMAPLPRVLKPDPASSRDAGTVQERGDATPYLGALAGAAVGLVAARWFVARGCKENCQGDLLLTSALGILAGGALGYRLAGGDIGDIDEPPPRRPWP